MLGPGGSGNDRDDQGFGKMSWAGGKDPKAGVEEGRSKCNNEY